jgi:hypothetical protein
VRVALPFAAEREVPVQVVAQAEAVREVRVRRALRAENAVVHRHLGAIQAGLPVDGKLLGEGPGADADELPGVGLGVGGFAGDRSGELAQVVVSDLGGEIPGDPVAAEDAPRTARVVTRPPLEGNETRRPYAPCEAPPITDPWEDPGCRGLDKANNQANNSTSMRESDLTGSDLASWLEDAGRRWAALRNGPGTRSAE